MERTTGGVLQLRVEKVVYGGQGIARTEQGVVFVTGALPGELVEATCEGVKGGCPQANVSRLLEPSPGRREISCRWAGECGGCDWLHITAETQVSIKREIALDCFSRIGRLRELPPIETVSAGEHGYRMRAQLKIGSHGEVGFFRRRTNDVVVVDRCQLLVDTINELLAAGRLPVAAGHTSIKVVAGDTQVASSPHLPSMTLLEVLVTVAGRKFVVAGDSFFQSNRFLLEQLGCWAGSSLKGDRCADLYGGTGFFSVMNAQHFSSGLLIELVSSQVTLASRNFKLNGMSDSWEARVADAEHVERELRKFSADTIIIDPPRPGLTRAVREMLARLAPQNILYVSCNPSTQARDLGFLVNRGGYFIKRAALFDLYPNTHHLETAVLLHRR